MSTVSSCLGRGAYIAALSLLLGNVGAVEPSDGTSGSEFVEISSHHFSVHHSSAENTGRNALLRRETITPKDIENMLGFSSSSNDTGVTGSSHDSPASSDLPLRATLPDVTWGSYAFNYIANTQECVEKGNAEWEGKSVFQTWAGTDSGLTIDKGTTLHNGVAKETDKGLIIYKAACPNTTAVRVGGTVDIPDATSSVEIVFGITRRCTGDCAPFMVSVLDGATDEVKYRWCWNREGNAKFDAYGCNESRRVLFQTWHREKLDIFNYVDSAETTNTMKLALEVYTSGDFRFLPTLPGEVGLGGRAMVLIDTLLFGPSDRPKPVDTFLATSSYCRQSMREVCKENSWCGDKYRCYSGWCSEGQGRCNKERNCPDDSDEVGCEYNNGLRAEFFLNHAHQLHANTDVNSLTHPDIRVLNEVLDYDEDDFWTKAHARDNFAVKWMGNFSIEAAGHYFFEFPDEAKVRIQGTGAHSGQDWNITSGAWNSFPQGVFQLTVSYVHLQGTPSITLKYSGTDTRGERRVFGYRDKENITATMTGARCDTMMCSTNEGFVAKPGHSKYLCHGVPCKESLDSSTCCTREYKVVSCGDYRTCALDMRGRPICWGSWAGFDEEWKQHPGPFVDISTRGKYICGIKEDDGMVDCWQPDSASAPLVNYSGGSIFTSVSVGGEHTCALRDSGYPACTGTAGAGQIYPPSGVEFSHVSAGDSFTCGIAIADTTVKCWGENERGQATPPSGAGHGSYTHLTAGQHHACGISNGSAYCWGWNSDAQADPPTGSDFAQVAAGGMHTCALKNDGEAVCWGANADGQAGPIKDDAPYSSISAGKAHTCAIRSSDKEVVCWGSNFEEDPLGALAWRGQASPPPALPITYG